MFRSAVLEMQDLYDPALVRPLVFSLPVKKRLVQGGANMPDIREKLLQIRGNRKELRYWMRLKQYCNREKKNPRCRWRFSELRKDSYLKPR